MVSGGLRVIMPFFDVLGLTLALLLWFGPILGHFRSRSRGEDRFLVKEQGVGTVLDMRSRRGDRLFLRVPDPFLASLRIV